MSGKETNTEMAIRTIEAFHALAMVLPVYDEEARAVLRGMTKLDFAVLLPKLFMDISRVCIAYPDKFDDYMEYLEMLIQYVRGKRKKIPMPIDGDRYTYDNLRRYAEQMAASWAVHGYMARVQPRKVE